MSSVEQELAPVAERTPEDWRKLLEQRLSAKRELLELYEAYYSGEHALQFATAKFREAFGNLFSAFADNWCEIVVDASVERLVIEGFRFGESSDADAEAWTIWQQNKLDLESSIAHTEAGKFGECFLLVDPNPDGEFPLLTVEHPSQMIVAYDPGNRHRRLAALKEWDDDAGYRYATIYLPDSVLRFQSEGPVKGGQEVTWIDRQDEQAVVANPLEVVPVVPLQSKPTLMKGGQSDLKPAIPLQNAVNKLCTDMIVASEYGAYRQRVLTGVEIPRDPETGKPIGKPQIEAALSRMWSFDSADARVTDLPATELQNFVTAIEMYIQHLAAQTRTPPHYLLGQVVNASGDALLAAEAGLVSKCKGKITSFSDGWEEAMALVLQATGKDVQAAECEVIWADPEQVSPSVRGDAAVKKQAVGVPQEVLWLELGYTPQQITDMKALAEAEQAKQQELEQQKMDATHSHQVALAEIHAKTTPVAPGQQPPPAGPGR